MNPPQILGIYRTQDGSISIFEGANHVMSIHKERLTKRKHHRGRLGDIGLYKKHIPSLNRPYDLIVECWSGDDEIVKKEQYHQELETELPLKENTRIIEISHHLSHLYSAWPPSGFDTCAAMIIDSVGSPAEHIPYDYPGKTVQKNMFEVASYYYCKNGEVTCIKKQLHDRNPDDPHGLGNFYYRLTECLFKGQGNEGKVMGLAAYGHPENLDLPNLTVSEGAVIIREEWQKIFKSTNYEYKDENKTFQERRIFQQRTPFMLFTAFLRDKYKDRFPTIEHVDHSARIQTVSKKDNAFIYDLIVKFKEKSGVGIIANTVQWKE